MISTEHSEQKPTDYRWVFVLNTALSRYALGGIAIVVKSTLLERDNLSRLGCLLATLTAY